MTVLTDNLRDQLRTVSTATLTTALFKRGSAISLFRIYDR